MRKQLPRLQRAQRRIRIWMILLERKTRPAPFDYEEWLKNQW